MTQSRQELFRCRTSTDEFLLCETDSKVKDDKNELTVGLDRLSNEFPDILAGKTFIDHAMARLGSSSKFGAMVIRIDNFSHKDEVTESDHAADILTDVAKSIDAICKIENRMWGLLDCDMFGCFISEKNGDPCLKLAKKIQKNLAIYRNETVTIGIASYPTINFRKSRILDNARKALDHAAFFGPDSAVCFDAVSLNISGDQLYQRGNIKEAVREFKTALMLDPSNVNVHNSLGVCYGVLGSFEEAIEEFETAIQLDPKEIMALYNSGLANKLMGNKDRALERFLKADSLEKDVFEVVFQTGRLYMEMERPEKGKELLEKAVRIKPDSGPAFRCLGECYAAVDMTDEAVRGYKNAIKLNPNDAASLSALGLLFDVQGENPEIAVMFCEQSIEISPENGLFRQRLGRLYLKQNRPDDALKEFEKAKKLGHN